MSRGVVLNQAPHQVDIVRQIGGGMVKSVRASAGVGEPSRPGEGHYACFLEFESGLSASLNYSGYAYFDSAELVWGLGEEGELKDPDRHAKGRQFFRKLGKGPERAKALESALESRRYGANETAPSQSPANLRQPFFGLTIVTCEGGDIRQSADGLFIYDDNGRREVKLGRGMGAREAEIREMLEAISQDRSPFHDGRWGQATLEVCLAMLDSSVERREIALSHQTTARESLVSE